MADDIDLMQERDAPLIQAQVANSYKPVPVAKFTGSCLCCGVADMEIGRRWCDAECRDLWELTQ